MLLDVKAKSGNTKSFNPILKPSDKYHVYLAFIYSHFGSLFYSMSTEIKLMQKESYEVLERTQRGNGDITEWLSLFLRCFEKALASTESTISSVLEKIDSGSEIRTFNLMNGNEK